MAASRRSTRSPLHSDSSLGATTARIRVTMGLQVPPYQAAEGLARRRWARPVAMAGPVPAIHSFLVFRSTVVDGWAEPGHDRKSDRHIEYVNLRSLVFFAAPGGNRSTAQDKPHPGWRNRCLSVRCKIRPTKRSVAQCMRRLWHSVVNGMVIASPAFTGVAMTGNPRRARVLARHLVLPPGLVSIASLPCVSRAAGDPCESVVWMFPLRVRFALSIYLRIREAGFAAHR